MNDAASTNKMTPDTPDITPSQSDFLADVERLIIPAYLECFSDETRKVRNLLLVISFVLILLSLNIIKTGQNPTFAVWGTSFVVTRGIGWLMMLLCTYFLALYTMRSYAAWQLWGLRKKAPLTKFMELTDKIYSAVESPLSEVMTSATKIRDDSLARLKKLTEQDAQLPEVSALNQELDDLNQRFEAVSNKFKSRQESGLEPSESPQLLIQQKELGEKIQNVLDQLEKHRVAGRERREAEHKATRHKIAELEDLLRNTTPALTQLAVLKDAIMPSRKILFIRFWWELIFPCVFAAVAVISWILRGMTLPVS